MGERQFGPYRLVHQIAVGGMAEIHLAKTTGIAGFEKYVALKMIHPNFSSDEQFIQMLIDEAKITVQLQHVNIAQTFDLGRVGEMYYITMEFVDGADLYKILRRGSERDLEMPVDVAAYVAKEMAIGLDYAHRKRDVTGAPLRIVHRDVSPQNVLISHAGEVKLVDFGIAKATMRARQTAVGVIKGKYYYMSPEQAWGDPVDHRSDIFSAGIVLYEMLTGQMLYLEEDLHKLLEMVRKADIAPPTRLRRDIPPQLERIVMHALAKHAGDRYPTAADFATDLERFLHVYSPVFTPSKVTAFCGQVLGDAPPPSAPPRQEPRDPGRETQRLERDQLVQARSEFTDENSVIFRMQDLARGAAGDFGEETGATSPDPLARGGGPRPGHVSTNPIGAELEDVEERTVVSGPPGFDGGLSPVSVVSIVSAANEGDFEPTVISGPGAGDDDNPTLTRDPSAPPGDADEAPTRAGFSASTGGRRRTEPPPVPPAPSSGRLRPARAMPAHPALSAATPQPAVSELRAPRQSRRTPAAGVPIDPHGDDLAGAPGSLLQAIVSSGAVTEPASGPTRPLGGGGGPSDGVPHEVGGGGSQLPRSASPWPQAPSPPPPPAPGHHFLPAHLAQGPAEVPWQRRTVIESDGTPNLPLAAPAQTPLPFTGLPAGPPPSSLTRQLMALEVDEIPDAYKIGRERPRWLVRAALAIGGVGVGVALALLLSQSDRPPVSASLQIESIPAGATVSVDGRELADRTPVVVRDLAPGGRHAVRLTLAKHRPWEEEILMPDGGGEVSKVAFLKRHVVKLRVASSPPGAEVVLDGVLRGRTPLEIAGLDPEETRAVELRMKGYQSELRVLTWRDNEQLDLDVTLQK